jgi:hypothetical protein
MIFVVSFVRILTNYISFNASGFSEAGLLFNFTPIGAVALFAGANFKDKKFSFIVPIAAMLLTDFILGLIPGMAGFHSGMIYIYGAFVLITFIGFWLEKRQQAAYIIGASLLSSVIFFLITNFAVWPGNAAYTQNFSGLIDCYVAGVPFFRNTIMGDLFFCGVLFGGYALVKARVQGMEVSGVKA